MTMNLVKELREKTGAGMMDCKRALDESAGNLDTAIEWLRKQGIAKAAKKATRTAKEGIIAHAVSAGGMGHTFVEVNCETDFVVKTDDFQRFAADVAQLAAQQQPATLEALLAATLRGETVGTTTMALTAKIGENIGVSRVLCLAPAATTEKIATYIHAGSKIGVLVRFADPANKLPDEVGKDIAMHVAAMNPHYTRRSDVPATVVEREKEIIAALMKDEKKPAEIIAKIVDGRVNKFYGDVCLEEQVFVKDPQGKQTVQGALKQVHPDVKILDVVRWQVGEKSTELAAATASAA